MNFWRLNKSYMGTEFISASDWKASSNTERMLGGKDNSSAAANSCTEHENEEDHAFPKNYMDDL